MADELIGHFKLLDKLGAGGMGEVYLAHDTKLDRKVAIKLLPDSVRYDATLRGRFNRNPIEEANFNGDTELANLLEELAKDLPEEPE